MASTLFNGGRLFVLNRRNGRYTARQPVRNTDDDDAEVLEGGADRALRATSTTVMNVDTSDNHNNRSSRASTDEEEGITAVEASDRGAARDASVAPLSPTNVATTTTLQDRSVYRGTSTSGGITLIPPAMSLLLPSGDSASSPESSNRPTAVLRRASHSNNSNTAPSVMVHSHLSPSLNLAELEEERELARRRTSACVMLSIFIFFRLWIEAFSRGDFGLLLLCLMGTSWTARWIRYNREREEELDRRIQEYLERGNGNTVTNEENESNTGVFGIERDNLRMLSFQAQLALAIMESQRQLMEGGYGHPDGNQVSAGVTDAARTHWKRFPFVDNDQTTKGKGGYGSLAQDDSKKKVEDVPHCSICLGEYEVDEPLVEVPCGHVYHEECLQAWTSNHTKCPLCNFDLESVTGAATATTSRSDSIV